MRIVLAGTPDVALPALDALRASRHELLAVLTRPDAPRGRGRRSEPSPVAARAAQLGLEVLAPRRLRDAGALDRLAELAPDAVAVVAYGQIVPPDALAMPRHGWINLHFSLLPAWRGAAPVQRAVIAGDDVTGATTFRLDAGLDTGPVLGVMTEPVRPDDTAGSLLDRLATAGARLLVTTVDAVEDGTAVAVPQDAAGASLAPRLAPDDARVGWTAPALHIDRLVRGCTPHPGAWTTVRGDRLGLGPVQLTAAGPASPAARGATDAADALAPDATDAHPPDATDALPPGELRIGRHGVLVGTGTSPVRLGAVRPAGRRAMPAEDWARGARLQPGERLG